VGLVQEQVKIEQVYLALSYLLSQISWLVSCLTLANGRIKEFNFLWTKL
jgi:hypothetical protein